jgi:hypothetical protein
MKEYNFNIRIVISGKDADELTEEQLTDFIKAELATGSYGWDNPLISEDFDCDINYVLIS